jgi:chromate transporter
VVSWLSDRRSLDATIAPGPVVVTVAFIGRLAAGPVRATAAALGDFLAWRLDVVPTPDHRRVAEDRRVKGPVVDVPTAPVAVSTFGLLTR